MDPAAQQFIGDLRELHLRAGKPSYATLERLSQHQLRRATVSDILNGNRVHLPDWRFVALFVEACRSAASASGLDESALGTLAVWKHHWDSAARGIIGARFPGSGYQLSPGPQSPGEAGEADGGHGGDSGGIGPPAATSGATAAAGAAPLVMGPVPPRLPDFAGRETWLAGLRATLDRADRASAVVIQGLCGIGKTQLAVEYAYRYAQAYDLIWWISCEDLAAVHDAMASLASGIGIAVGPEHEEGRYAGLFDALRNGQPYPRWLLVFDGAGDPEEIKDLIPPTIPPVVGHVLVTTRNSRWEANWDMLELDVFTREESVEFLRRQMRGLSPAQAHRLAEAVGDLPLVLEHAVEAQIAIDEYMARLKSDPLDLLDGQPVDYPATVSQQWRAAISRLDEHSPEALDLLRCLAFFGSEPVSRDWLERGGYMHGISIHELLRVPLRLAGAIRTLRRAGLLRVRTDVQTLEVHEVTRCVILDMVSPDEADSAGHDVHLLLAAADPLDPDDPANWGRYDKLRGHAAHSGAESCTDESVRNLVVNLTRSLTAAGNPRVAVSQADRVLRQWSGDEAMGPQGQPGAVLAMRLAKAEALLACGRCQEAFQLQEETLSTIRAGSGERDAKEIPLNSMAGVQGRISGRFADAREADLQSAREHAAKFDREHPQTFLADNGVIADLALEGEYDAAAREAARVYADCLAFHNDPHYPAVLLQQSALGRCQWLCGRYGEAVATIGQARAGYNAIVASGSLGENHPWRLANRTDHVVARRDSGVPAAGLAALAGDMHDVRRRWWRSLGVDHPQTLAATVILASVLLRIPGQSGAAIRLLAEAEGRYQSVLPGHPFADACKGYLAAVQWQLPPGSPGRPDAPPVADLEHVIAQLTRSVGEDHPLTLYATVALASVAAGSGELEAALELGRRALPRLQSRLGSEHPHALACEANVATISTRLGQEPGPGEIQARYEAAAGAGYPDALLFSEGGLVHIDFTPLPL